MCVRTFVCAHLKSSRSLRPPTSVVEGQGLIRTFEKPLLFERKGFPSRRTTNFPPVSDVLDLRFGTRNTRLTGARPGEWRHTTVKDRQFTNLGYTHNTPNLLRFTRSVYHL